MVFCFLVAPRKEKVVRLNSGIADRKLPLNYSCFMSDQDSVTAAKNYLQVGFKRRMINSKFKYIL